MSSAPTSLRRNLSWVLAGNLGYAACQWGMLVVLARLGDAGMVGDFALALAVTAPLFILAMLNLRAAQATDQRREFAFADYVHLRILGIGAASVVLAGILALGSFGRDTAALIALVGVAKACDAFSDVVYGLLQQHERMRRIGTSRLLQGTLQLLALAATLTVTGSVLAAAASMAAVSLGVTLLYDLRSVRVAAADRPADGVLATDAAGTAPSPVLGIWRTPRWDALRRLLVLSLPLGAAAALDALNANVPRYVLDAQDSRVALGHYAAIAYFLIGQGTVLVAVADAARPRLARAFLGARDDFARLLRQLSLIALAAGLLGLAVAQAAGGEILRLVYGPDYATETALFVWIMAAAIPWNLAGVVGTALAAARRFRALSLSFVAMIAVTTLASLVLVPAHGALGAAWALGLGMLARLAAASLSLWHVWQQDPLPATRVRDELHGPASAVGASAS